MSNGSETVVWIANADGWGIKVVMHHTPSRYMTISIGSGDFTCSTDISRHEAERLSNALSVGATRLALAEAKEAAAADSEGGEIG